MNTNLLDLNTDILNVIGDFVRKDRMEKETDEAFELVNKLMGEAKNKDRQNQRFLIFNFFHH